MKWRPVLHRSVPYLLASSLLLALQHSPLVETANLLVYDLALSLRHRTNTEGPEDLTWPITVVGISEDDIKHFTWPLDDTLLCTALQKLDRLGAAAIGLDVYRDQAKPCLQDEVQRNPRLISIRNESAGIAAIPGTPAQQQAFNDLVMDADRVVRRDLMHVGEQEAAIRSLPLRLLETARKTPHLDQQLEQLNPELWLEEDSGGYQQLDAAGYQTLLPVYPPGRYPTVDLQQVLRGPLPERLIRNRIVLIGHVAPSLRDLFEIPHSRFKTGTEFFAVPGVELHGQRLEALQNLLKYDAPELQAAQGWQRQALLLAMVLLGVAIAERPGRIRQSVVLLATAALLLSGSVFTLTLQGLWLGLTMPLAGLVLIGGSGILGRGVESQRHQQQMQRLLGQTSSPAVAQQLWEHREELIKDGRFEGREQRVTVLFSDTCNFTTVSEQLTPSELMQWLNRGISLCVDAVTSRGGMVNKFTGDGLFAVFGAPVSSGIAEDAAQAVAAALDIQRRLASLNTALLAEGLPTMHMRIGLHSGPVLTGSLGSSERLEYAVMGDTVNCASRLESIQKERQSGVVRVLLSATTHDLLEAMPDEALAEPWGAIHVKGRQEPLEVIELKSTAP